MVSVNNIILKKCFDLYDDSSIYSNYTKIAFKYHKYYKENKEKKFYQEPDKLKEDVKKWLFSQSLESRMKICTVENEFLGKILYQMYFHYKLDKTIVFKTKLYFYKEDENTDEQFTKNITSENKIINNEKEINFPKINNNNIKVTKLNKDGKKTEAPKLGYSQMSLDNFSEGEVLQNNFGNFFGFYSNREYESYTLASSNNKNYFEKKQIFEKATEDFLKEIIFFSVHHKYYPDCFTLSPELLLEREKFENYFTILGNKNYFSSLIKSDSISKSNNNQGNKIQKIYEYFLPDWFQNKPEIEDITHKITEFAISFFEQVIMIKYLLNKNEKKTKIFSLLNEDPLNRFFSDRKSAINYMKKTYNKENKINILNELNMDDNYKKLLENKHKMDYIQYYNLYRKSINCQKSPYIDSINFNPHSNKYEEQYNKMNKITRPKNLKNNKNINGDLTYDEIKEKIKNFLENNDNISFVDYLLFDNYLNLWKLEYFYKGELFEKMSELVVNKNVNELIFDSNQSKPNKSKHRRKNKKNNNKKEEEKNNINNNIINEPNKIKNEYEGIFKDEEEELYAPYYLKANTEQKKLYNKIKEQNYNIINHHKEMEEIKNFISKEIILGLLIDRIFLIPLNNCLDFYEKYKEDEVISDKNEIKQEEEKKEMNNEDNKINFDIKEETKEKEEKEKIENEIDNVSENDLSIKKSESMSVTTQDTNNNINLNLDTPSKAKSSELKNEYNNENDNDNNDINNNSNDKNNSSNKNSSKKKKKKEMFLFATVKKSKKKSNSNTNNISLISNEFSIITLKESNSRLSFFDKLHNDIIKYETKVISLLNHGMKFHDFCITEIKRLIQETLNFSHDYIIEVYGSYATGLMIEASDIDIKIKLNKGTKDDLNSFFKKVCEKLEQEKKFDEINPIETASVPVIKLLLSKEKFIKGKTDLENSYKQYKELSLFKHYLFDINELTKIKIDVTFILPKDNLNNNIKEEINNINNNIENNINDIHDHNKSIESELSSVSYVKEQIVKYPEVKFILRVLKRYFYYKKMNTAFLGGLSSYNLFLLLLSYAKFLKLSPNSENTNLGYFLFHFLYFFKVFDFKQYIININSKNNIYDILPPESAKEFNLGKSIVIIDPLTGVNASKSSYKIDDIQNTFSEAFDFFQNEEIKYGKEGKTKVNKKNSNNDKTEVMGLPKSNKNENNHGGGNIIEKFLGK